MARLTALGKVLHEEHFRILIWICDLQNRVTGDVGGEPPDLDNDHDKDELQDLIGSLDQIMAHHAFEEDVVFPLLRTDGNVDLTNLLIDEHAAIEPTAHRLRGLTVEILRQGPGDGRWSAFREVAQELFCEMIGHMEKEELSVLQRLDSLLDPETDHRLALQLVAARLLPVAASNTTSLR